jgi:uncharacterized protein YqeY
MSLVEQISADRMDALRNKDKLKNTLLTTLLGEVTKKGKDKGAPVNEKGMPLTDDVDTISVVKKFLDGVNDTIKYLGENNDRAKQICLSEKAILEVYQPRQMTKDQIKGAILTLFERGETMNKGNMMQRLKAKFVGQYDGRLAAQAVDEMLG